MKAIVLKETNTVELQDGPAPGKALPGYLLVQMKACAINSGDKLFISGAFPRGISGSKYGIAAEVYQAIQFSSHDGDKAVLVVN